MRNARASDAIWGALFAASANGGAYSSGVGGAYGRRAAWISLAALLGRTRRARRPSSSTRSRLPRDS